MLTGCATSVEDADTAASNGPNAATAVSHDVSRVGPASVPDPSTEVTIQAVRPIPAGGTQRFVAMVRYAKSRAVTWSLGEGDAGTIDKATGEYQAPIGGGRYHVTATSVEDPTAKATSEFVVSKVAVRIDPSEVSVAAGATYALHAMVENSASTAFTWSIDEGEDGGLINAKTGVYTAPRAPGVYHVVATSAVDETARAVTTVSVPFTPLAVTPMVATIAAGGTRVFSASIAAPHQDVSWRVAEASGGAISAAGVYTAPAGVNGVFHVIATSTHDASMTTTVPVLVGNVMPAVGNEGGPVAVHPKLVAVTFAGDALASDLETFAAAYGSSDAWTSQTAEYGVGAATTGTPVHVKESLPASMDNDAIQTWLANKLDGTHPEFGTATADSVYTIYIPQSTTVVTSFGSTCAPLGGYHTFATLKTGLMVPFTVVARCHGDDLDWVTQLTSHELVEAVTDPEVNWNQAFAFTDDSHAIWGLLHPEVGDMCEWDAVSSSTNVKPVGLGYQVQRTWSNAEAARGHEPCVPKIPGEVYFSAIPSLSESVSIGSGASAVGTQGMSIAVGHSKTFDVNLISDGPREAFNVYAWDMGAGTLKAHFDRTTGVSGDTLHLTITVLSRDKDYAGEPFEIIAFDGAERHSFYGFIGS